MGDAEKPGGEPRGSSSFAEVLISFEKHVLAQIECVFPVLEDAQQVIEDHVSPSGK